MITAGDLADAGACLFGLVFNVHVDRTGSVGPGERPLAWQHNRVDHGVHLLVNHDEQIILVVEREHVVRCAFGRNGVGVIAGAGERTDG